MRTGGYLPSAKGQRPESDHLPPSSIVVKKEWSYTSATYAFMACTGKNLLFF